MGQTSAIVLMTLASLVGAAGPVYAQSPVAPSDARVQVGPLALSPVINLRNFGYDSNVFNLDSDNNPQSDITATLTPAVDWWLRLPHARMRGRSQFDIYYFKELTDLNAVDTDNSAHVDLLLNRLTPYVEGSIADTRHRQNLEIDAIASLRQEMGTAGAELRLTPKVFVGGYARRGTVEYEPDFLYLNSDLASELNHRSNGEGGTIRWGLTPYTTFAVEMARQRDRFDYSPDRDADLVSVTPSVEFSQRALVGGRASIGYQKRRFLTGGVPDYSGFVVSADLNYTLLERTRFAVAARRSLEYSYIEGQRDYVSTDLTVSVMQRLGVSWDAGGSLGRGRVLYQETELGMAGIPDESILSSTVNVGYNIGRTRVGFLLEHRARQTDQTESNREYERLRAGATLAHTF